LIVSDALRIKSFWKTPNKVILFYKILFSHLSTAVLSFEANYLSTMEVFNTLLIKLATLFIINRLSLSK